jgi:hypothetical protein
VLSRGAALGSLKGKTLIICKDVALLGCRDIALLGSGVRPGILRLIGLLRDVARHAGRCCGLARLSLLARCWIRSERDELELYDKPAS